MRTDIEEAASCLALTRLEPESWARTARDVVDRGSARRVLEQRGHFQAGLFDETSPAEGLLEEYTEALNHLEEQGIHCMAISSPEVPARVTALASPPLFLFYRGTLDSHDQSGVAVIGSRRVPQDSLDIAREWSRQIGQANVTVISGLAAGIDREAHLGALDVGARTVAVIGTGISRAYPKENAKLQDAVAEGGLVVSQFLPDASPSKISFPMRNAVMAAWARATLVIDADDRSGAALQARLTVEQGGTLFIHEKLRHQGWANKFVDGGAAEFVSSSEQVIVA